MTGKTISIYVKPEDADNFEWARQQPRRSLAEVMALALISYRQQIDMEYGKPKRINKERKNANVQKQT